MSWQDVNDAINKTMGGLMDLFFPRKCPFCQSVIDEKATRCPHCTSQL